jgi:hypothetical protein
VAKYPEHGKIYLKHKIMLLRRENTSFVVILNMMILHTTFQEVSYQAGFTLHEDVNMLRIPEFGWVRKISIVISQSSMEELRNDTDNQSCEYCY